MNLFRFLGDMSHILSFVILLLKITQGKSAAGISLRTQELYEYAALAAPRTTSTHLLSAWLPLPLPLLLGLWLDQPPIASSLTRSAQSSSARATLTSSGTSRPCTIHS